MKTSPRHNRAGFTLLEVLLAMFVIGAAVVLLSEGYTQCVRTINANREDTTLALLAQGKMAELAAGIEDPDFGYEGTFEEQGHADCIWSALVTPTETPGLNAILLTVSHVPDGVVSRTLTFHRLIVNEDEIAEVLP